MGYLPKTPADQGAPSCRSAASEPGVFAHIGGGSGPGQGCRYPPLSLRSRDLLCARSGPEERVRVQVPMSTRDGDLDFRT